MHDSLSTKLLRYGVPVLAAGLLTASCATPNAERSRSDDTSQASAAPEAPAPMPTATRPPEPTVAEPTAPAPPERPPAEAQASNEPPEGPPAAARVTPDAAPKVTGPTLELRPWFAGERAFRLFRAKKWSESAAAFERWLESNPGHTLAGRARILAGVSRLYASQPAAATKHLEQALGTVPVVDPSVRLLLAEAAARLNRPSDVVKHTKSIPAAHSQRRRADLLQARALRDMGRRKAARRAYATYLESKSTGVAVLEEAADVFEGADSAHHAEALRRIVANAPHTKRAVRAEKRLNALPKRLRSLRDDELLVRLETLMDDRNYKSAGKTAAKARKASKTGSETWCQATRLAARALEKSKRGSRALPLYASGIRHCKSTGIYPALLYFGGKRAAYSGDAKSARAWWKRLVKSFPKHRYTDDALIQMADELREAGDTRTADKHLLAAIDVGGDMQEKAAWQHFWSRWEARDYKGAVRSAEHSLEALSKRRLLVSRGRLVYWLGRALERRKNKVRAGLVYARVMREYPLGWYALLAQERLKRLDSKAAKDALLAARTAPNAESILTAARDVVNSPAIRSSVELLRLGLITYARAELDRARPSGPDGDWVAALLYDRVGEHTRSYKIARWKRPEHTAMWPVRGHAERWRLANPRPPKFQRWVKSAAKSDGVDEALIWAVMQTESAFKSDAVSFADAVGLMQLIEPTGRAMAKRVGVKGKVNKHRLKDPELNIKLGTRFLSRLAQRFSGHPALMAAAYNAGPGRPGKWMAKWPRAELDEYVERIPFRETRRYVKSVVTAWARYRALYDNAATTIALRLPRG